MCNAWGAKCNMMYEQERPKHITHKSYFTNLILSFFYLLGIKLST
jgi:hypothetical protein